VTRQEFIDDVTTWSELLQFCYDEDYDTDDIYSSDSRDDYINDQLMDWARNDSWREMLETLRDLEDGDGYDYYRHDDYDDWIGLCDGDGEFDSYKNAVLEWMDENEYWPDDDDEEEEDEEYDDEEEAPPADDDESFEEDDEDDFDVEDEDCSVGEMFAASVHCIRAIAQEEINAAKELDMAFISFVTKA